MLLPTVAPPSTLLYQYTVRYACCRSENIASLFAAPRVRYLLRGMSFARRAARRNSHKWYAYQRRITLFRHAMSLPYADIIDAAR